jgi:hypothetical protein
MSVRRYDKILIIYIYFNQSQDSRPAEIQSCDVIGWKKYRWSKFYRTMQGRNHRKNLGATSAMVGRICPHWLQ